VAAAKLALADFEAARGRYARALELHALDDAAGKDATSGVLLAGLGEALAGLDRRDEALATLDRALAATLTPELRARAERTAARLKPVALAPDAPPKKGPGAVLWIGVGGGAAVVVAAAVVIIVFVLRASPPPDSALGAYSVPLGGGAGAAW
jgi:tetratricopeptide (TPR) repeat protein